MCSSLSASRAPCMPLKQCMLMKYIHITTLRQRLATTYRKLGKIMKEEDAKRNRYKICTVLLLHI